MTNKKIVIIVASVVVVLGLLVVLFVGGIAWFALRAMGNSEAAETAQDFLQNNEVLKRDIGEVRDFGCVCYRATSTSTNGDGAAAIESQGDR